MLKKYNKYIETNPMTDDEAKVMRKMDELTQFMYDNFDLAPYFTDPDF